MKNTDKNHIVSAKETSLEMDIYSFFFLNELLRRGIAKLFVQKKGNAFSYGFCRSRYLCASNPRWLRGLAKIQNVTISEKSVAPS